MVMKKKEGARPRRRCFGGGGRCRCALGEPSPPVPRQHPSPFCHSPSATSPTAETTARVVGVWCDSGVAWLMWCG